MLGWVRLACAVLCVGAAVGAGEHDWLDSLSQIPGQVERLEARVRRHHRRRHRRPSVPEVPAPTTPAPALPGHSLQVQQLLDYLSMDYQSDAPHSRASGKHPATSGRQPAKLRWSHALMSDQADNDLLSEALASIQAISTNYTCREPSVQLVQVAAAHPSASEIYVPPSVPLRRCSDQAGCCVSGRLTCVASTSTTVRRAVIVKNMVHGHYTPKYLKFREDTSCHCVTSHSRRSQQCHGYEAPNDASHEVALSRKQKHHRGRAAKEPKQKCRCPTEFVSRPFPDGHCKCDCFDGNKKCTRVKRGKTYLSESQNRCIKQGKCDPPRCSSGTYMKRMGRCPRPGEKLSWAHYIV